MQQRVTELADLNAELVAISPELPENSLAWVEKNGFTFRVVSDSGNRYARQCGLVFTLAEELKPIYKNWGINLPASNGEDTYELPLPATYVVARDSTIVLSFVDPDYTIRLEPGEIIGTLKTIATIP